YRYLGLEPDSASARVGRPRIEAAGGRLLETSDEGVEEGERFDVVCAFEVLEHVKDDAAALRRWVGRLASGGWLVLSVPAFQRRYAAADRMAGHFRRYDPDALRDRLLTAGLHDVQLWVTGFPLGLLLEQGRNWLATR